MRFFKFIAIEVKAFFYWLNFKLACRNAMRNWKLTGCRYYVIKTGGINFAVVSSKTKDNYNRVCKKLGVKKVNFHDLIKGAYFITPLGTYKARHNIKD